ncbi:TadE/TadG family type IV pilus assembly protein [Streptomyces sp. NPDC006475]|uniref:TadE/TadG family type IV pilus assembly protein n=1 Tax=Streptomyces sp. NPDC006475 TaxID=3155719 RepID=UPI0033A75072
MNHPLLQARPGRRLGDRGDAAIQAAIVYPLLLLVVIGLVQAALWGYARNIAQTAAREGVQVGRAYGAGPEDGARQARSALERLAGDNLTNRHVSTTGSTAEQVRIRVSGTALSLIPGVANWHVSADASGAVERWVPPRGR